MNLNVHGNAQALSQSSIIPESIQSSGYCLCSVSVGFPQFLRFSSTFKKTLCVNTYVCFTAIVSQFLSPNVLPIKSYRSEEVVFSSFGLLSHACFGFSYLLSKLSLNVDGISETNNLAAETLPAINKFATLGAGVAER